MFYFVLFLLLQTEDRNKETAVSDDNCPCRKIRLLNNICIPPPPPLFISPSFCGDFLIQPELDCVVARVEQVRVLHPENNNVFSDSIRAGHCAKGCCSIVATNIISILFIAAFPPFGRLRSKEERSLFVFFFFRNSIFHSSALSSLHWKSIAPENSSFGDRYWKTRTSMLQL